MHENTENKHIHISCFEKEQQYFKNGGKLDFHAGPIKKEILINIKRIFEQKLTNATAEIVRARKDLNEKFNISLNPFQLCKKTKKLLLALYDEMPKKGRTSYDSENMLSLKNKVDDVTKFIL